MLGSVETPEKAGSARTTASRFAAAFSIRSMSITALSLLAAVGLATAAAGGSYAYLNARASLSGGTVTAGTASLQVTALTLNAALLAPGETRYGAVTVTNTGDVALALRVAGLAGPTTSNSFSQSLVVGASIVTSAAACTAPLTQTWTGKFAAAPAGPLGARLVKGTPLILCVSAMLPANAPSASQDKTALNFTLSIDGTQA